MSQKQFSDNINSNDLQNIGDIKFTPREIDIIACVLCGKNAKGIAQFLSYKDKILNQRSVETHILNIRRKIKGTSKNSIIVFIEKSGKYREIHHHYLELLLKKDFYQIVKDLAEKCGVISDQFLIEISFPQSNETNYFMSFIEHYLKYFTSKIKIIYDQSFPNIDYEKQKFLKIKISSISNKQSSQTKIYEEHATASDKVITLLIDDNGMIIIEDVFPEKQFCLTKPEEFYLLFMVVLKVLFSNLDHIIEKYCSGLQLRFDELFGSNNGHDIVTKKDKLSIIKKNVNTYQIWWILITIVVLTIVTYFFGFENREKIIIHRDIEFLKENSLLLNRDNYLNLINKKFEENSNAITIIALLGEGGTGKTTIAREYAKKQRAKIIWELNATDEESIKNSFDQLAWSLANTQQEQTIVKELSLYKNNNEKVIEFIKNKLLNNDWFLIFDNVDSLACIQEYFPASSNSWGNGKILITSSNKNIQHNSQIKHVIFINPLEKKQRFELFSTALNRIDPSYINQYTPDVIQQFLEKIPPFPLDIIVAASYLSFTHSTFENYIKSLYSFDFSFNDVQLSILREQGNYLRTRQNIISLAIEKIINESSDFRDLLIMMTCVDSTQIPKVLFERYKDTIIVDNFIYYLRKYSLINNESFSELGKVFILHPAIQKSILQYIKKRKNLIIEEKSLENIIKIIEDYIAELVHSDSALKIKKILQHSKVFLDQESLLPRQLQYRLALSLGAAYYSLGYYHKSVRNFLEHNVKCLENTKYADTNIIADTMMYLGHMYRKVGNYKKAQDFYQKYLNFFSVNHPYHQLKKATIYIYLGAIHVKLGDYKKAKKLFEESLLFFKENQRFHFEYSRVFEHMGIMYTDTGDYKKSQETLQKALNIETLSQGDNNPLLAWLLLGLGRACLLNNNLLYAEKHIIKGIKLLKENFPDDQIGLAWGNVELSRLYMKKGDLDISERLVYESIEKYEENFGKNHVLCASLYATIASLKLLQNQYKESEEWSLKTLKIYENNGHPLAFKPLEILGDVYFQKAKVSFHDNLLFYKYYIHTALMYFKGSLKILESHYFENSNYILRLKEKIEEISVFQNLTADAEGRPVCLVSPISKKWG